MKNNQKEQSKQMPILEFVNTFMPELKLNPYQTMILSDTENIMSSTPLYKHPLFWRRLDDIIQDEYTKYKKSYWYDHTTIIIDDPISIPENI